MFDMLNISFLLLLGIVFFLRKFPKKIFSRSQHNVSSVLFYYIRGESNENKIAMFTMNARRGRRPNARNLKIIQCEKSRVKEISTKSQETDLSLSLCHEIFSEATFTSQKRTKKKTLKLKSPRKFLRPIQPASLRHRHSCEFSFSIKLDEFSHFMLITATTITLSTQQASSDARKSGKLISHAGKITPFFRILISL